MSRRGRAIAFLLLALTAAGTAAAIADRYGSSVSRGYGRLRPVVVTEAALRARRPIGPEVLASKLAVRRVPERFVPSGALASPREALGLATTTTLPAGSYLLAAELRRPRVEGPASRRLSGNRGPVEIAVSGAAALLAAGPAPVGARVDVVVTSEPGDGGRGRTYVAAVAVPLLALDPGPDGPGPGGTVSATLALTKPQALRLISAESFARALTLLPTSGG
jgi:Flp pilus assembly protein CpaB